MTGFGKGLLPFAVLIEQEFLKPIVLTEYPQKAIFYPFPFFIGHAKIAGRFRVHQPVSIPQKIFGRLPLRNPELRLGTHPKTCVCGPKGTLDTL